MKYKVIGFVGLFLLILGVGIIVLQLMEGEKKFIATLAGSSTPVVIGIILIGMSQVLKRKMALVDRSNTQENR